MAGMLEWLLQSGHLGGPRAGLLANMPGAIPPPEEAPAAADPNAGAYREGSPLAMLFGQPGAAPAATPSGAEPSDVWGPSKPSTNDPFAGEPQPIAAADVPLPRPRPNGIGAIDDSAPAPLSLAPSSYDDALPPNAQLTEGRQPIAPKDLPMPGTEKSLLDRVFNPNNAATLLALGGGFAGAGSIGTGMRRAFSAAAPAAAVMQTQNQKQQAVSDTYRAVYQKLTASGMPSAEAAAQALAMAQNPQLLTALAPSIYETKPAIPHSIGKDRFGNDIMGSFKNGKFYDIAGREIKPSDSGAGGVNTGQPQDGGGLTGEAFLKSLPDRAYADKVKAIAEGREPFPQGQIMRSPYGRKLGEDVLAYDPTFDAVNYKSRETTRKDFTSGKSAQNLTAFNTAIGHLETLDRSISGLNNSNWTDWNKLANNIVGRYDPKFQQARKEFESARTAVADELTRAFRGSGGNVHDIKQWEKTINEADSPPALRAAVKQAAELLRSRIDAVGDQYNKGMQTTKDPLELLNPKAAAAFKRLHEQDPQRGSDKPAPGKTSTGINWSIVP